MRVCFTTLHAFKLCCTTVLCYILAYILRSFVTQDKMGAFETHLCRLHVFFFRRVRGVFDDESAVMHILNCQRQRT